MDEGTEGIIVFVIIKLLVASVCHIAIRFFWLATLVSAVSSSILFNIAATIHQGYLDKFFLIAFIMAAFFAFVISSLIGLPFVWSRRKWK